MPRSSMFSRDLTNPPPVQQAAPPSAPTGGGNGGGLVLVFFLIAAAIIALSAETSVLEPVWSFVVGQHYTRTPAPSFTDVTTQQDGDVLSAQVKTDSSHSDQLCDQIMEEIYVLAQKNSTAHHLVLSVQVDGGTSAKVQIEDLDVVRNYRNKIRYETSDHRQFVGTPFVDAGMMPESSLAKSASVSVADDSDIIGNFYQVDSPMSPHFGMRFLDETRVEFCSDGAGYTTRTYTVSGDTINVSSPCTPIVLHKKGTGFDLNMFDGVYLTRQKQ